MIKLLKFLWYLISKITGLGNKPKPSFKQLETKDVVKPIKVVKTHEERLKTFKEKLKEDTKKHYPIITNKSYHRSYERLQAIKEHKQYLRELKLQGKGLNDKGDVINKQQPYRKDQYKSLEVYNRYARGFNYNNR